jgi:ABC-2 type transport system ATP-binding protein
MDDVKELCDRVIIIDKGTVFFDGLLDEIIKKYADRKILEVTFSKPIEKKDFKTIRAAKIKKFDPPRVTFSVKRKSANSVAAKLLESFPVADLNILESSIEDIIREVFTGRDLS